jgi:hypothetical protein
MVAHLFAAVPVITFAAHPRNKVVVAVALNKNVAALLRAAVAAQHHAFSFRT